MYEFIVHNDAAADLREIYQVNPVAAKTIGRFIGQLRADQDLLDRLTQHGFGGSPARPRPREAPFNVSHWAAAREINLNLWRMRFFDEDVLGYRLIYAYRPPSDQYVLLAIVEKAETDAVIDERFDYELQHPIAVRILASYRGLDD